MTTNDVGRWPVYTAFESAHGVPVLNRNGVFHSWTNLDTAKQIVSDFAALAAENKRLREAMEKIVGHEDQGWRSLESLATIGDIARAALAEPTP